MSYTTRQIVLWSILFCALALMIIFGTLGVLAYYAPERDLLAAYTYFVLFVVSFFVGALVSEIDARVIRSARR